jgi:hypothetical protein
MRPSAKCQTERLSGWKVYVSQKLQEPTSPHVRGVSVCA